MRSDAFLTEDMRRNTLQIHQLTRHGTLVDTLWLCHRSLHVLYQPRLPGSKKK